MKVLAKMDQEVKFLRHEKRCFDRYLELIEF